MKLLSDNHLFWDTDIRSIDITVNKQAIIERVLERGSWDNIKELIQFYGREEIVMAAKNARWFSEKTVHFVSGYFDIPLSEMRCYKEKQLSPIPYL
jgi:hypothetical protein